MNLLLDQGLPRLAAVRLTEAGHAAVHVGDIGLATAEDSVILERASTDASVIVTLDADFHAALANLGRSTPSVVRIRIEGLGSEQLSSLIARVISEVGDDLRAGAMASVGPNYIRVRRLPIR